MGVNASVYVIVHSRHVGMRPSVGMRPCLRLLGTATATIIFKIVQWFVHIGYQDLEFF